MPAPKRPNNAAATAESARVRTHIKHKRWATEMSEAGWTVIPPEDQMQEGQAMTDKLAADLYHAVDDPGSIAPRNGHKETDGQWIARVARLVLARHGELSTAGLDEIVPADELIDNEN